MRSAVKDAQKRGFLGDNVFGSGQKLNCEVMEGAGAFVCGEETAMIASIEGQRGMPRPKPPFPAQSGLWGKPTIINNVETLAHVVRIINEGAEQFRKLGTAASPGTKTFALTGHVANTGLIEVPFGTTLREVVFDIGGGITDRRGKVKADGFKAVQIGGPSGGCLTREHLDLPLDYDSLRGAGAMVGSGGLVAMNKRPAWSASRGSSWISPSAKAAANACSAAKARARCWRCSTTSSKAAPPAKRWTCWRSWRSPCRKARSAAWARRRPIRCSRRCAISARNTTRTCFTSIVPPASARRWPSRASTRPNAKAAPPAPRNVPSAPSAAKKKQAHVIDQAKCIVCGVCADTCKLEAVVGV
jgi:NADH-quinone oxidoreductase subunit F